MKSRPFSPRHADIGAFIESQADQQGALPIGELPRLAEGLAPEVSAQDIGPVSWHARGQPLAQRVGAPQLWLQLDAHAELPWVCQRCLQPVTLPVTVNRKLRFVADEEAAARLDADLEDDVLAVATDFDLIALIEDELIMAAPIVPRHPVCPEPPPMSASDPEADMDANETQKSPFAVLARLKNGGKA